MKPNPLKPFIWLLRNNDEYRKMFLTLFHVQKIYIENPSWRDITPLGNEFFHEYHSFVNRSIIRFNNLLKKQNTPLNDLINSGTLAFNVLIEDKESTLYDNIVKADKSTKEWNDFIKCLEKPVENLSLIDYIEIIILDAIDEFEYLTREEFEYFYNLFPSGYFRFEMSHRKDYLETVWNTSIL